MTERRLEIAEIVPATRPRDPVERTANPTRPRQVGQIRQPDGPSINLDSVQHYECLATLPGWYQVRIEASVSRPDVDSTGIILEIYDAERAYVGGAQRRQWASDLAAPLIAALTATPTASMQEGSPNVAAFAAVPPTRRWWFDVWLDSGWTVAWRGFTTWNDADGRVVYMGRERVFETGGVY